MTAGVVAELEGMQAIGGLTNMDSTSSSPGDAPEPPRAKRGSSLWVRRILLGLIVTVLAFAVTGGAYQSIASEMDRRHYPPPGQLVDVGGYRLHIYCTGEGGPTVILDALF